MPNEHVLENFVISDNSEFAKCNLCGKWLKYLRTSSSLLYHIQKVHGISSSPRNSDEGNGGRDNIDSIPNTPNDDATPAKRPRTLTYDRKRSMPPHDAEAINNAIYKMIAVDMLPLSFTEKKGFQNVINVTAPGYNIPGRKSVTNNVKNVYSAASEKLLGILPSVPSLALTTDAWTSTATVSYVTVTSHHLNDDFELLSYTIDTFELSEKHSHENLIKALEKVTSNWGIRGRITATVHDNARNITKAVKESNLLGDSVPCFAHTLQLALKNALLCAEKVTDKATKIVGHFSHSAIETAALKAQQKIFGLPEHKLEQSCKTRWNSTYRMLKRLLEQRSAVESVLKEFSNVNLKLTEEEWNEISALSSILEPFDITTTLMSSQTKVTLSMVRPLVFRLKDNFLRESTADTEMMKEFKRVLNQGLTNRILQKTSAVNEEPSCALIAQFLDPRYKNLRRETEDNKNIVISKITTLLESPARQLPVNCTIN